jgi:hypothetical protein
VLQPVIQFGTAIHGKSFSGGTLNCVQKFLHVLDPLSVLRSKRLVFRTDSNKPGCSAPCGSGHTGLSGCIHGIRAKMGIHPRCPRAENFHRVTQLIRAA